ncbi:MAG: hypothetical protein KIT84_13990 [Labilithrix sp.]|nr:hypothetical protein [Labilithrix sp.]MCW5812131.1 hypothetical protein [Labilithrix sp.]
MSFLFGDLSRAPFVTNFLEELRDALDFAGGIAAADQTIVTADVRREEARGRAEVELARLEALAWATIAAAEACDRGGADSASARLAAELGMLVNERRDVADAAVRTKLEEEIVVLDADVVAAREDYFPTLQDWLLVRAPPKAKQTWRVELIPGAKKDLHRYRAELGGESPIGLAWTLALAIAEDGIWAAPLRVSRLAEDLAIVTPQLTGLVKKEVKSKRQKVDRHWITGVVDDGETMSIELRAEIGEPEGFTVTVDPSAIALVRTGRADDPTVGAFPVAPEDEPALRDLAAKVRELVRALPKQRLVSATFDGLPFDGTSAESQPKLVEVVARLVESLAPTVDDIASRSRSETELVLRRELDDGRREELFMPKARLREKFSGLDEAHQKLFAAVTRSLSPKVPSEPSLKAVPSEIRSEIAQPEPPYVRRRSSGSMNAVVAPLLKEKPPAPSSPSLEVGESEALKQARSAAKEGRLDDMFRQYGTVFASGSFASMRPDDQRQALKLMFFGKQPDVASDDVKNAYRVTLPILQALVLRDRDPADYELLGMAYAVLEEPEKAMEIFKKALDVERARNPASDLCGSLMRRVSQL